jgi:hypothetical protein
MQFYYEWVEGFKHKSLTQPVTAKSPTRCSLLNIHKKGQFQLLTSNYLYVTTPTSWTAHDTRKKTFPLLPSSSMTHFVCSSNHRITEKLSPHIIRGSSAPSTTRHKQDPPQEAHPLTSPLPPTHHIWNLNFLTRSPELSLSPIINQSLLRLSSFSPRPSNTASFFCI